MRPSLYSLRHTLTATLGCLLLCLCSAMAWADPTIRTEGVSGDIKDNLEAYLGKLDEGDLKSWRNTQSRLRTAARQAMASVGYYQATFDLRLDKQTVTITVNPGAPILVHDFKLRFEGEAGNDVAFTALRESLSLKPGDVLHHGKYESLKGQIQNLALERGYFDAEWVTSDVAVNVEQKTADITLVYNSGDRYRFGVVSFDAINGQEDIDLRRQVLMSLVPFHEGDPYDASRIIKLNKVLLDARYFSDVRVRVEPDQAKDKAVPVLVTLSTGKPNNVDVGVGYSTDVGPRLSLAWRRPLLNSRGHGFEANTELSEVRRSLDTKYTIPLNHPIDDTFQILYGVKREQIDTSLTTYTTVVGVQRQTNRESGWQRIQSLRFTRDTDIYDAGDELKTDLLLPGFSLSRVRSHGGLDPDWGDRQFYQIEFATPELLSDADLVSLRAGFRLLRTLADKHQFQLRLDGGAIFSSDFNKVPSSLRFFAGGDQSVRGYDYKSLAPRDATGDIVGGKYLATGTAEYGYLFLPRWRGALFVDGGNAFDNLTDPFKIGTGFGIRWISPVGAVRLDFAWGVSEQPAPFRIHFSMGPAL